MKEKEKKEDIKEEKQEDKKEEKKEEKTVEEKLKEKLSLNPEEKVETRGRPKGSTKKDKKLDFKALLGASKGLMNFGFEILASRKGKHWLLSEKELEGYSEITDQLIIKYLPFVEKYGLEVAFVIWTGNIFLPRFKIDTQNKLLEREKDKKKEKKDAK